MCSRPRSTSRRLRRPDIAEGHPVHGRERPAARRRVGARPTNARRRRLDRRPRLGSRRTSPVRPRRRSRFAEGSAPRRIAHRRDRARRARPLPVRRRRRSRRRRPAPSASSSPTTAHGEANGIPTRLPLAGRDDRQPRRRPPARVPRGSRRQDHRADRTRPTRARDRAQRRDHELLLRWADRVRTRPQARPRGTRRTDPLVHPAEHERVALRGLRRNVAWPRRTSRPPRHCCSSFIPAGRRHR